MAFRHLNAMTYLFVARSFCPSQFPRTHAIHPYYNGFHYTIKEWYRDCFCPFCWIRKHCHGNGRCNGCVLIAAFNAESHNLGWCQSKGSCDNVGQRHAHNTRERRANVKGPREGPEVRLCAACPEPRKRLKRMRRIPQMLPK